MQLHLTWLYEFTICGSLETIILRKILYTPGVWNAYKYDMLQCKCKEFNIQNINADLKINIISHLYRLKT